MNKSIRKKFIFIKHIKARKLHLKVICGNYHTIQRSEKLLKHLRNELESSTTHGLPYFVDSQLHHLEKFFWASSFVLCLALAALLLNMQYLRFISAPIVMSVEINNFDWNISYPAITLCPLYKPDKEKFATYVDEFYNRTGSNIDGYLWAITQGSLDTLEYLKLSSSEEMYSLIHPKDYATLAASMFREIKNSWLTTNTNQSITVDAAMTEMGMCHVINSNVALYDQPVNWNPANVITPVKNNIELSIFEANFFAQIQNYTNVYKVFIHSPDEITSSTTSFTFDVQGTITFGLSVWSSRISEELRYTSLYFRKCRFTNEPISKRYPVYSYSHCVLECRIRMIKELCGCVPHFFKPLSHERVCYLSELECVLHYRDEIVTLKTSKETLRKHRNSKELPRTLLDCGCVNTCDLDLYYKDHEDYEPGKVKKLIIKITSFPKVRVVRDIIISFYDMVLRSGGVINLCIGSSVISIVEFILVILKIFLNRIVSIYLKMKQIYK